MSFAFAHIGLDDKDVCALNIINNRVHIYAHDRKTQISLDWDTIERLIAIKEVEENRK